MGLRNSSVKNLHGFFDRRMSSCIRELLRRLSSVARHTQLLIVTTNGGVGLYPYHHNRMYCFREDRIFITGCMRNSGWERHLEPQSLLFRTRCCRPFHLFAAALASSNDWHVKAILNVLVLPPRDTMTCVNKTYSERSGAFAVPVYRCDRNEKVP